MANIEISRNDLLNLSEKAKLLSNKLKRIECEFTNAVLSLDWEIKAKQNINLSMRKIKVSIEKQSDLLNNHNLFLEKVVKDFKELENNVIKETENISSQHLFGYSAISMFYTWDYNKKPIQNIANNSVSSNLKNISDVIGNDKFSIYKNFVVAMQKINLYKFNDYNDFLKTKFDNLEHLISKYAEIKPKYLNNALKSIIYELKYENKNDYLETLSVFEDLSKIKENNNKFYNVISDFKNNFNLDDLREIKDDFSNHTNTDYISDGLSENEAKFLRVYSYKTMENAIKEAFIKSKSNVNANNISKTLLKDVENMFDLQKAANINLYKEMENLSNEENKKIYLEKLNQLFKIKFDFKIGE